MDGKASHNGFFLTYVLRCRLRCYCSSCGQKCSSACVFYLLGLNHCVMCRFVAVLFPVLQSLCGLWTIQVFPCLVRHPAGTHGAQQRCIQGLVEKPERKGPLGKHRRRWEGNNTTDLYEVRWGGIDWIDLAQGRHRWRAVVNALMNFRVP